jgi:hypothetical protein
MSATARERIRSMLTGGDRRSIGLANEVADLVGRRPRQLPHLIECLWDPDSLVRMRAADAAEKLSRDNAVLMQSYKGPLLGLLAEETQQEVRWHLASIVPRLRLTRCECRRVAEILRLYLGDRSSIVKTFSMQGLADLISQNASLRPTVLELLRSLSRTGTPAMRARGRILLRRLEPGNSGPELRFRTLKK